jgi:F0F1-type ATP synthase epsilon subunit
MPLSVSVFNPKEVIFTGEAKSIVLPGEQGVFELLPFHKPILSRLISGTVFIDGQSIPILRGVVKAVYDKVTIIIEEREEVV